MYVPYYGRSNSKRVDDIYSEVRTHKFHGAIDRSWISRMRRPRVGRTDKRAQANTAEKHDIKVAEVKPTQKYIVILIKQI